MGKDMGIDESCSRVNAGFLLKERGVALIMVLLALVFLATASVYMVEDDQTAIRSVENQGHQLQARYLCQSALQWALLVIKKDGEQSEIDHSKEPWNQLDFPIEIDNGNLNVRVEDAQGRFNVNNLRNDAGDVWLAALGRLLNALDGEAQANPTLRFALKDWVDGDQLPQTIDGAEDDHYLLESPAYRTADDLMVDVSELARIRGIDAQSVSKLSSWLVALPETGIRINANTASPEVLRILAAPSLAPGEGEALVLGRGEEGYATIEDVLVEPTLASYGEIAAPLITLASKYFIVTVSARFGRISMKEKYLVRRNRGETVTVDVVRAMAVS